MNVPPPPGGWSPEEMQRSLRDLYVFLWAVGLIAAAFVTLVSCVIAGVYP